MNILFVLYGDFKTNTANPIVLFSKELQRLGHECIIAVPSGIDSANEHDQTFFTPVLYDEVLKREGRIFSNGAQADVVHACTLRMGVVHFLQSYLIDSPAPLVVYLEDNETWIVEAYLGLSEGELSRFNGNELAEKIPSALSNPFEYPYILALANLVILIQEKLQCEVPLFIPTKVIPWGVDQTLFHPSVPKESKWRELFEIKETEKVIVYHGGLNGFTRPAMMDLCKAVELINLAGVPCKLIRTGVNPINFWDELNPGANKWIIEAGVVGKDELPSILSLADIYVQPGRINPFEDLRLPSKLPEFLAMGKPVILPNVNIAHLFQDGVNAVLLQTGEPQEIAEKCLLLFNDEKNCESLGLGARQFAQDHFEIGKQVMGLISAYKDAISFFNPEQTKNLWATLKTEGAMGAALKSAGYCLEGPAVDRTLVANQLLIWGHQNNNQLQLLNKRYFELQQLNTRLMDSASKMPSSHFWQKLRRFFKL